MNNLDLNEKFLGALRKKITKQTALVTTVEEVLKIEKESAYRRVKGIVQFSVREMGILARSLNISLDNLLTDDKTNVVNLRVFSPRVEGSLDERTESVSEYLEKIRTFGCSSDSEIGGIYTNLPIEYYVPYDYLFKLIYYRWAFYYVGPEKCRNFASWKIPDNILKFCSPIMNIYENTKKVLYVWDKYIIHDLVEDIKFYISIGMINKEDVERIKKDMHTMLSDLERLLSAGGPEDNLEKIEFYISNMKMGVTYIYTWNKEYKSSYMATLSLISTINEDETTCNNIRMWVKSLKKISTLISGTGDKERILFFRDQRQIVDSI